MERRALLCVKHYEFVSLLIREVAALGVDLGDGASEKRFDRGALVGRDFKSVADPHQRDHVAELDTSQICDQTGGTWRTVCD